MSVSESWHSQPGDLVQAHAMMKLPWIDVCLGLSEREDMDSDQEHEVVMRRSRKSIILHPGWIAGARDPSTATLLWRAQKCSC